MVDSEIGISAAVAIGTKFVEPSEFTSRHDGSYNKEVEKSLSAADRFEKISKEDISKTTTFLSALVEACASW